MVVRFGVLHHLCVMGDELSTDSPLLMATEKHWHDVSWEWRTSQYPLDVVVMMGRRTIIYTVHRGIVEVKYR